MKLILVSTHDEAQNLRHTLGTSNAIGSETHVLSVGGRCYSRVDEIEDRTRVPDTPSAQEHWQQWRSHIRTRLNPGGIWNQPETHPPP
jgi:hypothetical protein